MPVEDQVVQIFAATNGFIDRILVEKVREFLDDLSDWVRGNEPDLLKTIAGGDWSDETRSKLKEAVNTYAEDFGYDLDEEGLPLEDGNRPSSSRRTSESSDNGSDGDSAQESADDKEEEPARA